MDTTEFERRFVKLRELVNVVLDTERTAGEVLIDSISHSDKERREKLDTALQASHTAEMALVEATEDKNYGVLCAVLTETFFDADTPVGLTNAVFTEASQNEIHDFATTLANYKSLSYIANLAYQLGLSFSLEPEDTAEKNDFVGDDEV